MTEFSADQKSLSTKNMIKNFFLQLKKSAIETLKDLIQKIFASN